MALKCPHCEGTRFGVHVQAGVRWPKGKFTGSLAKHNGRFVRAPFTVLVCRSCLATAILKMSGPQWSYGPRLRVA